MRLALAITAVVLLAGCDIEDFGPSDRFHSDFHYTYDLKPGGHVNVDNFNGQVEIDGWDQDKVEIIGTKFASTKDLLDSIKIEIHNTSDSIDIRTVRPSVRHGGMGARYTIHVPRKAELDRINSSNGGVRVHDIDGQAHLRTSNGGVRVNNLTGSVEAQTSNGPIELEGVKGTANMRTSNGRIHAENVQGQCEAATSNGSIVIRFADSPSSPLKFSTTNGSIELTLQNPPKGDIRANTSNGGITLHLPAATAARVHADTSNSSISTDFDVNTTVHGVENKKNHLDGAIGSGGPSIDLTTSNGHIRLVKGV